MGHRHQQTDRKNKWYTNSQEAIVHKHTAALAHETRPHKQAGQEEQERNEIDVLESAEQVKTEPTCAVDNRDTSPLVRRIIEAERGRRRRTEIRLYRMDRQHNEDNKCPEIAQRNARGGHRLKTPRRTYGNRRAVHS